MSEHTQIGGLLGDELDGSIFNIPQKLKGVSEWEGKTAENSERACTLDLQSPVWVLVLQWGLY